MKPALLDLELALRRESALFWLACALALGGALLYAIAAQPLNTRIAERESELGRVEAQARETRSAGAPEKSLLEERLVAFNGTLCEKERLNAFVGTVFEQAARQGLSLAQAEYKLEHDKAGGFSAYQMTLPVRGAYPRLRKFVDATLAEIPCAAIEDVDFKREAIGAGETDARLRFVLFLKGAAS
jgi:hypothetical protein